MAKAETKPKAKTTAKRSSKSPAKSLGRRRNAGGDQALSSDPIAKNDMRKRTKRSQTEPAPQSAQKPPSAGTGRVIAEWDKVDAALDKVATALIELTRSGQTGDIPPLTIREIETTGGRSGWAVVSGDPQVPLTEQQARDIVAAMQSLGMSVPIGIAAE